MGGGFVNVESTLPLRPDVIVKYFAIFGIPAKYFAIFKKNMGRKGRPLWSCSPKEAIKGPNFKPKTPAERQAMRRAMLSIELRRFDVAVRHRQRFVNGYDKRSTFGGFHRLAIAYRVPVRVFFFPHLLTVRPTNGPLTAGIVVGQRKQFGRILYMVEFAQGRLVALAKKELFIER